MKMDSLSCCKTCDGIQVVLKNIFKVLDVYKWLLDAYVVDFFYEDLWSKLPSSWRNTLQNVTPQELGLWMLHEEKCNRTVWPLSLLALRQVTKSLQISRNHNGPIIYHCKKGKHKKEFNFSQEKAKANIITRKLSERENKLLLKRVKSKKHYEIEKTTEILSNLAAITDCTCIVDIGAGVGHLSRVIAVKHDLQVIRVEQDEVLLDCARKLDQDLITKLQKHDVRFNFTRPYHLAITINDFNIQSLFVESMPKDIIAKNGFGIVGLHPCGNLAVNLMRFYTNFNDAKFLCIVGCCYMKISTGDSNSATGYPLSQFLLSIANNSLSYNALEVACHAKEKHCDKLKLNDYEDLKVHTFRAVLEYLLAEKNVKFRHNQLRSVKVKGDTNFQQYCLLALENIDTEVPTLQEIEDPKIVQMLDRWNEVLSFGFLRLMLAPLVETVILLDRFLYLSEANLRPSLKAEYDSRISPRNFVLTSYKL